MKKLKYIFLLSLFLSTTIFSYSEKKYENDQKLKDRDSIIIENKGFRESLDYYLKYLSDQEYNKGHEYIYIEAETSKVNTKFIITLGGGSYDFFHDSTKIIDFINYKNYNILLVGDFPNIIVNVKKNTQLSISRDILLKYFKKDYEKYKLDKLEPAPEIYDYMNMTLEFNYRGNLTLMKCQYY